METADEEIVSSTDSDSYIDEFKAEDYNFYIINDEEAKNFILQNCVGAKIKTNTTKKKEFKSEIQTLPGFSCHDRTSRDDELGKNQCKKVSLKDTFVAEVLNDSTKSFIERLHLQEDKNDDIGKETELICSTNSSCMTTSLSTTKNSPREQQSSQLQDNSSMAVSAENSDHLLAYQSEEAQIKSSIEKRNDSRKKYVQKITLKLQGNRSQRGKRKDLCQKDSRSKKKMKVTEIVGNKDSKQGADPNESLVIPENISNEGDENVTSQREPAVQLSKQFDIHATGNTAEHSYSSTNAPHDNNTLADRDKTDNEWTAENLCLYGLELSEDGVLCDLIKKEEIGDFPTCPHGCIDLTSSEHLFHLHLAALKLAAREKDSQEKIEILSGMNSKYTCQPTDSAPEINSEEVHVSLSGRQSEGNIETVQNVCIKENLLNAEATEKISNEKPANSVDSEKVYQYLNSRQLNGGENKEQQTVITSVQTSLPSAVSYSIPVCNVLNKLSEVGSQWPTSYNRTLPAASAGGAQQVCSIGQEEAVQANPFMYNVMAPTATNRLYQQDIASTLATGSSVTDSFIVSKPHPYSSTPGSYTWYTKQAQPVKNFFTAPHISAHAMNSPWYQQWFHAMNLRRSMASHSPSSACNYFEPLTTNNYRETLWKIPHVTQQRMYQRTGGSVAPRLFQPSFPSPHQYTNGLRYSIPQKTTYPQYICQQIEVTSNSPNSAPQLQNRKRNLEEIVDKLKELEKS